MDPARGCTRRFGGICAYDRLEREFLSLIAIVRPFRLVKHARPVRASGAEAGDLLAASVLTLLLPVRGVPGSTGFVVLAVFSDWRCGLDLDCHDSSDSSFWTGIA